MLHHIEPKYSLNCCTYLIWFEFETSIEFELKTLEKINRKGNINSRKIEKAISAQADPFSPARTRANASARPLCLIGGSRLSAPTRSRLSPSLSLSHGPDLSALVLPRAPAPLSLSRRPHLSVVSNLSPTISPPWTRPRPRVPQPRSSPHAPFEPRARLAHLPSPICALCPAPSPSLSLSLCPREPRAPPLPADIHRLFRGRCCARAPSSATVSFALPLATQDTLRCALFLPAVPGPCSPEQFLHSRSPAVVDQRLHRTPPFSKRLEVRTRGEQPSHALNLPIIAPEPTQLLAGVSYVTAKPFSPQSALSGAPMPVLRPRLCSP
jgi:hypothetical protein